MEVLCREVLCWEVLCKADLVSPRSCDIGLMSWRSYVTASIFRPYFGRVGGSGPFVEKTTYPLVFVPLLALLLAMKFIPEPQESEPEL